MERLPSEKRPFPDADGLFLGPAGVEKRWRTLWGAPHLTSAKI